MNNDDPHEWNIHRMTDFRPNGGFHAVAQVEAYWEALRGNRMMPRRSEIDPRGIETALENTFVLERIAPGMARLRIAGSHLGDILGMEVRGMPLTSFITPKGRGQLGDALEDVFQRPCIGEVILSGEIGHGKPALEARMLLLPLKSDLGDVSRVLGCLVSQGEIGRSPRRFDVKHVNLRQISANDTQPDEMANTYAQAGQLQNGMAEDAGAFKQKTVMTKVPYLRLVKTDS